MKYNCKILDIKDEDVITILIDDIEITGFLNDSGLIDVGMIANVEIELFDDITILESSAPKAYLKREGNSLSYVIVGILNIDKMIIESSINFSLNQEDLYDYGYLDGKMVEIKVLRIDFSFDNE